MLWGADDWCRVNFQALGSNCQLIFKPSSRKQGIAYRDTAVEWVTSFEQRYSRFKEDSMLSQINRSAGQDWVEIDGELESIAALCDHYHWVTGRVFDPSALPLMKLWNYKAKTPTVPTDEQIQRTLPLVGWRKVQRRAGAMFLPEQGMALDLGGIGKEYAVDRVLEMAAPFGIVDIMVDFGRDVRSAGKSPTGSVWRVGLEHPTEAGQCWGGIMSSHSAVATSGDYLRGFYANGQYYSHILDVRTGRPVANGSQSATVVAPSCTEAGVLATTTLVLGPEAGLAMIERSTFSQGCLWTHGTRHETSRFMTLRV
jgi:thiamine biosynthesis lipoprotein